jgi:hypothetical protein
MFLRHCAVGHQVRLDIRRLGAHLILPLASLALYSSHVSDLKYVDKMLAPISALVDAWSFLCARQRSGPRKETRAPLGPIQAQHMKDVSVPEQSQADAHGYAKWLRLMCQKDVHENGNLLEFK